MTVSGMQKYKIFVNLRDNTNNVFMRKTILIAAMAIILLAAGCDSFRRLAGRPTTVEIAAKRAAIVAEEERLEAVRQARRDSIERESRRAADSLAVLDSLGQKRFTMYGASSKGGLLNASAASRYYVILGSFMDKGNAEYLRRKAEAAGYDSLLLPFRNGFTAVAVSPSDSLAGIFRNLKKVKQEKFCPDDVWVLDNR